MSKGLPSSLVGSRVWAASQPPRSAGGFPFRRLPPLPGPALPPAAHAPLHTQQLTCRSAPIFPAGGVLRPAGTATGLLGGCRRSGPLPAFAWRWQHRAHSDRGPRPSKTPEETSEGKDAKAAAAPGTSEGDGESITASVSKYLHLPKMAHRPTKEELLGAANGFWERVRVRFKWMSIRSMRPWNADEWGAFVSWFMLGHLVWILVGTTTFFSLLIFFINTVFAQGEPRHRPHQASRRRT